MGELKFHEETEFQILSRKRLGSTNHPGLINFLLHTGLVKNQKQANRMLITFLILISIAALLFYLNSQNEYVGVVTDESGGQYSLEEFIEIQQAANRPDDL